MLIALLPAALATGIDLSDLVNSPVLSSQADAICMGQSATASAARTLSIPIGQSSNWLAVDTVMSGPSNIGPRALKGHLRFEDGEALELHAWIGHQVSPFPTSSEDSQAIALTHEAGHSVHGQKWRIATGRPGVDHRPERPDAGPDQKLIPRTHPGQELLAQTSGHPGRRPIHERPLGSREGTSEPASSVSDQRRTEGPDPGHERTDPFRPQDPGTGKEKATEGKPREVENQGRPERELQPGRVPQALYPGGQREPGSTGRGTNGPVDILT